jgi:hypothetical protein
MYTVLLQIGNSVLMAYQRAPYCLCYREVRKHTSLSILGRYTGPCKGKIIGSITWIYVGSKILKDKPTI